jgi:hypothetical protein
MMKKLVVIAALAAATLMIQTSAADVLTRWTFETSGPAGAPGTGNFLV